MKYSWILLSLLIVILPANLSANTLYFPQVAFGGGYSTTFVIINTGTAAVSSSVVFYDQNGTQRPEFTTPVSLAPASSMRFTLPNTGSNVTVLWGELNAGAGTVRGVATFDLRSSTGALQTTAGVLGADAGNSFMFPADVVINPSASTGFAVANVGAQSLSVRVRLIGENGREVQAANVLLSARGQTAKFVNEIFTQGLTSGFKGTVIIEAPSGAPANTLAATALTVKENILSALPVLPGTLTQSGGTTLYFPQVAYGGGYSTSFVVMNTSTAQVDSAVFFYNQQGVNIPSLTTAISIPSGGSTRFTIPSTGSTTQVAWGELSSPLATVKGVATFDLRASSGALQTTAGVLGIEAGNSFTLPVDVNASRTSSTGIAIANVVAGATFNVRLRLINENGSANNSVTSALSAPEVTKISDSTREIKLAPFGPRFQIADFITTWFPELIGQNFRGAVVVEVFGSSAASLAATALTVKEEVLSALPVLPVSITGSGTGGGGTGGGGTGGGGTGGGGTGGGGTGGGGGGGGTTSGPASACFNSQISSGGVVHLETSFTSSLFSGTAIYDVTYTPNVQFEGQSLIEAKNTLVQNIPAFGVSQTTRSASYFKTEGMDILNYGGTTELTLPMPGTIKIVNTPPTRDRRYSLAVGETQTQAYNTTTTTTYTGQPPTTTTTPGTFTVKYLGHETVTVPAGTFETCKFDNENGATITWEAVNTGVPIKSQAVGSDGTTITLVLERGTINGSAINP